MTLVGQIVWPEPYSPCPTPSPPTLPRAEPRPALQVVSRDGKSASIANVYTDPAHRKQGYAKKLLLRARKDFRSVVHASEGNISDEGKAWRAAVDAPVNVKSGVALKPVRTYL